MLEQSDVLKSKIDRSFMYKFPKKSFTNHLLTIKVKNHFADRVLFSISDLYTQHINHLQEKNVFSEY